VYFLREECESWLTNHPQEIGGMDDQGHPIMVAIDESNSFHRKYHRGQWREGHWVFAGIESGTGKCFLIEVSDRTAATLQPLIQRYILQGSHIMSDGWPSYANIDQLGHGIYMHSLIVHQRHFVDPADADVHTEQTETATPIWHVSRFVSILSARVCFPQQVPRSGHVSHHPEDNC